MIGGGVPDRQACRCASCRARDAREFERIVAALTRREPPQAFRVWPETESLAARVAAYTYGRRTTNG